MVTKAASGHPLHEHDALTGPARFRFAGSMAWVRIGSLDQFPPGEVREATAGDQEVAVCHVDGAVHVVEGVCPHRGGPLGQGTLCEGNLECPWHSWQFDCRTGVLGHNPTFRLKTYDVKVEGGDILISVG